MATRNRDADLEKLADAFFENLTLSNEEYGAWGLDCKRPFGNSYVEADILEIIGWEAEDDDEYTANQEEYANALYSDLGKYLRKRWKQLKNN